MAKQHLDTAQIRTVIKQMCRERMPQRVGCYRSANTGLFGVTADDLPERLTGH